MPGLFGFTKMSVRVGNQSGIAKAMQDSLVHRPYHCSDALFEDQYICASRVYLDTVRDGPQPYSNDGIFVWFDGEFYNREDFDAHAVSDAQLLLEQYRQTTLESFLKKVDGIFSAVIYDQKNKVLRLITDRYGLRYLYVSLTSSGCCWASEIKALCRLPSRSLTIDRESAVLFFSQGYLPGNTTWFPDIELLGPGTMLTMSCDTGTFTKYQYLDWLAFTGSAKVGSLQELVHELGVRFKCAVDRRCRNGERIALGLSGGLDSRAIFAAMPSRCEPIQVFSFGVMDSNDIRIARRVLLLRPSKQQVFEIKQQNWLRNRADAVWWTDGQLNILHMHGVEFGDRMRELFDIHLNGILSDSFLGAVSATRDGQEIMTRPDYDRRFIAMALNLANQSVITRMPFFDAALMELGISAPLYVRKNSYLYHQMLLATFPLYYQDIPWEHTGIPISRKGLIADAKKIIYKCTKRLLIRLPFRPAFLSYTNYPSWIRHAPAREFFSGLLTSKKAAINDYVDPARIRRCLVLHNYGLNCEEMIGRYATFELWLQKLSGLSSCESYLNRTIS